MSLSGHRYTTTTTTTNLPIGPATRFTTSNGITHGHKDYWNNTAAACKCRPPASRPTGPPRSPIRQVPGRVIPVRRGGGRELSTSTNKISYQWGYGDSMYGRQRHCTVCLGGYYTAACLAFGIAGSYLLLGIQNIWRSRRDTP